MGSGKTRFIRDLIVHLGENTNVKSLSKPIKVLLCYNDIASIESMKEACHNSEYVETFHAIHKAPSFSEFQLNLQNENYHYLIILEGNLLGQAT